jgi:hypothetical protein
MSSLPYPYNIHQLKTILKNADHFKHKIPHFDIITKPLQQLLQSDNFVWNDHYQCLYAYLYRFSPFHYINLHNPFADKESKFKMAPSTPAELKTLIGSIFPTAASLTLDDNITSYDELINFILPLISLSNLNSEHYHWNPEHDSLLQSILQFIIQRL